MQQSLKLVFSVLFGDRFFQLKGRSGLLEFGVIIIVYGILPCALFSIMGNDSFIRKLLLFFIVFMQPWILWSLEVRRFHDLNLRGWGMLTMIARIILPFGLGKEEQNRFDVNN